MLLSIVLPCYKPPEHWAENVIREIKRLSERIDAQIELIIVEDGIDPGLDPAISMISKHVGNFRRIKYEVNHGKGYALREGIRVADGDICIYTDIDFPYTTGSFCSIYNSLRNGECEFAVGIKNDAYYTHVPFSRRVLSKGLRRLIRLFLSIPVTDTQCGLKGFVKTLKPVFLETTINRYLFEVEFIRMAAKRKYRIKPVQIELNPDVQFRVMNYRILLPEIINFIKVLLRRS